MADLRAPTLGRETELALLMAAAGRAAGGASETWLIVAPPGTGKTRLLDELAADLAERGWGERIYRARFRGRDARPFGALTDLAAAAVGDRSEDDIRQALVASGLPIGRADVVADALLDLAGVNAAGSGMRAESRDARFTGWLAGLDGLAAGASSTWLVEDVHWAGPDAIAFLELARSALSGAGRLVVASARPAFLEEHPEWARDGNVAGSHVLDLAGLPPGTTVSLVAALVGDGVLPPEIVQRIAAASDGNCLFVEEILRLWVSAGILIRTDGAWSLRPGGVVTIPTSVQATYAAQLDELAPDSRQVVRRGAVSGRRVADGWLDRLGVAQPRRAMQSLLARRLLEGPTDDPLFGSAYAYRHALLRDAAYASLARADRALLHVRFMRWLAGAAPEPEAVSELLGDHLEAALDAAPALAQTVGDDMDRASASREAAHWLEIAADRALRAGARDHAVDLFARAAARTPTEARDALDLARRERRLGEATAEAGSMAAAVDRLRSSADRYRAVLRSLTDAPSRKEARTGLAAAGNSLARVLGEQLLFKESAATADGVLSELGEADDVESAWLRLRAAVARNMFSDDPADLAPTAAAVIPIAERDGDRQLALEARLDVVSVADTMDPKFATNAAEVVRLARELGRPDVECRALRMQAIATAQRGDDPAAFLDEAAGVAVNHGLDEALGWVDYLRADLAFARGDWDEAMAAGVRAIDLAERRQYHRVAVRSWFVVVPIATARDEQAVLEHADRWFTASDAFFPDSPYGRLMHTSVDLHLSTRGVRSMPDLSPERLLPSFSVDPSASWVEAADMILRAWLSADLNDAGRDALGRMAASGTFDAFTDAAIRVMHGRVALAEGDAGAAAAEARAALGRLARLPAGWWNAKALRVLEQAADASSEEVAAAEAIERRLGLVGRAP